VTPLAPTSLTANLPLGIPDLLGGLTVSGINISLPAVSVSFGGPTITSDTTLSDFLAGGGLLLSVTPGSGDAAQALKDDPEGGDRVTLVQVGSFNAALTWADPDENGVREHNIIWSSPGVGIFKIEAVLPAVDLVNVARELVCG
jgi:hypothetical protein